METSKRTNFEKWMEIEGYDNYYISNNGIVYSKLSNKELKQKTTKCGYKEICLVKEKKKKYILIHRLVAKHFIPNNENKPVINHIDGDKANNNINNLEWCTQSENNKHAYRIGLKPIGEKHHKSKLTNKQREEVRKSDLSSRKLGKIYGVTKSTILRIKNQKGIEEGWG